MYMCAPSFCLYTQKPELIEMHYYSHFVGGTFTVFIYLVLFCIFLELFLIQSGNEKKRNEEKFRFPT